MPVPKSTCLRDSLCIKRCGDQRTLPSFPTRRSSDLMIGPHELRRVRGEIARRSIFEVEQVHALEQDRKSTRLNSSHPSISYAVFCLKKKTDGHSGRRERRVKSSTAPVGRRDARTLVE